MKRLAGTAIALVLLTGCAQKADEAREPLEVQTIENTTPRLATLEPPPVLEDGSIPPRRLPADPSAPPPDPKVVSEDEAMRAKTNLPFTPSIAMDPVDGSKLTITPETPILSYEDRWYYFSSEANKRQFAANPEQFLNQQLGRF